MRTRVAAPADLPQERSREALVVSSGFIGRIVQVSLVRAGHSVTVARTAEDALERLDERRPHLLIIDLELPELADGLALLRRIRKLFSSAELPIAVLGDEGHAETVAQASSSGADLGLTKPFDPSALIRFLNDCG